MTDLRTLLHDAAAEPTRALDLDALAVRARRHTWRRLAIWLGSLTALIGGTFGAPLLLQPSSPDRTSVGVERPDGDNRVTDDRRATVVTTDDSASASDVRLGFGGPTFPVESEQRTDSAAMTSDPMIGWVEVAGTEQNGPIHVFDPNRRSDRVVGMGVASSFSPDSRRIVYFVTPADPDCDGTPCPAGGTYVKALDEHGAGTRISPYGSSPDWSPRDDRIVFVKYGANANSSGEPQLNVYVINSDGTDERRVTNSLTRSASDPTWSPDGSKIAFVGQDNYVSGTFGLSSAVYVMNADGSDLQAVRGTSGIDAAWSPTWSPDGTKIAFMTRVGASSQHPTVRIVELATGHVTTPTGDWNAGYPAWSPDGTTIAFLRDVGPAAVASNPASMWLMDTDGSNRRQVLAPQPNGMSYIRYSR